MKKYTFFTYTQKIFLTILTILLIISFFLIIAVGNTKASLPKTYEWPKSELSQSIFDAQNTSYIKNEELPTVYNYKSLNYQINFPNCVQANVGNGTFLQLSEKDLIYTTETIEGQLSNSIEKEVATVFFPDMTETSSSCDVIAREKGYINGFTATWLAMRIRLINQETIQDIYLLGYWIELPEDEVEIKDGECPGIFLSLLTKNPSNEVLQKMQDILVAEIFTLRERESEDLKNNETAALFNQTFIFREEA